MRCLSPHSNYSIQVIEADEQIMMDARGFARTITVKEPVIANFDQGGLLDYEIEAALSKFSFSGLPEGVNPLTRIASFDTEAFCEKFPPDRKDEMQVQIDQRLELLQERHPSEFIIVRPPAAEKPWPSYDDMKSEDILRFQEILRVSPTKIRLYELENKNRPEIVIGMLEIEDPGAIEEYKATLGPASVDVTVERTWEEDKPAQVVQVGQAVEEGVAPSLGSDPDEPVEEATVSA